jgi:hypothetical protein
MIAVLEAHDKTDTVVWYNVLNSEANLWLAQAHCDIVMPVTVIVSLVTNDALPTGVVVAGLVVATGVVVAGLIVATGVVVAGLIVATGVVVAGPVVETGIVGPVQVVMPTLDV